MRSWKRRNHSAFLVLVLGDEHREFLEGNYIFVPKLGIDIHIKIWKRGNEEIQSGIRDKL